MMRHIRVNFIDTSVMCNILMIPGKCSDADPVQAELKQRQDAGEIFILPITAVVETGNFIAQIDDGRVRRTIATKFSAILRAVAAEEVPWRLNSFPWDSHFIERLINGGSTHTSLIEHAVAKVGTGDLAILVERDVYVERTGLGNVVVWTLDAGLAARG